jgi:hypothetical protein
VEALVNINEAFSYQFEDVQWPNKLGIGALLSLVPILNFAVVGYEVGIVRNVAAGASEPLPQWDDLGQKWRDGLLLTLAGLVYAIPVFLFLGVLLALLLASGALSQNANAPARTLFVSNVAVLACFLGFLVVYSLLLSLIRPVILILFSRDGTFESCFRLDEVIRIITRQPQAFFSTWTVIILAGLGVGLLVGFVNAVIGWIPCIGWTIGILLGFGTAIYLLTVDGYIYGQFRRVVWSN